MKVAVIGSRGLSVENLGEYLPKDTTVTMAYVPFQNAGELYAPEQALCRGTLFPELDKPFEPEKRNGGNRND